MDVKSLKALPHDMTALVFLFAFKPTVEVYAVEQSAARILAKMYGVRPMRSADVPTGAHLNRICYALSGIRWLRQLAGGWPSSAQYKRAVERFGKTGVIQPGMDAETIMGLPKADDFWEAASLTSPHRD